MATMITSECINCGACEPECPNTAIYQGGVEWELNGQKHPAIAQDIFYIVPEKCTECVGFYDHEACAAVCPVDCCIPNPDIPETEEVLLARAKQLHPDVDFPPDFPSRFRAEAGAAAAAEEKPAPETPAQPAASAPAAPAPKPTAPPPPKAAAPAGRPEKPLTPPKVAPAAPTPPRPEKAFPSELPLSFEEAASLLSSERPSKPTAFKWLVALSQPVLGALPWSQKQAIERAVADRRFFSAAGATGLNAIHNMLLYPVILSVLGALRFDREVFSNQLNYLFFFGLTIAALETMLRMREGLRGLPAEKIVYRGALYGLPLALPLAPVVNKLTAPEVRGKVGLDGFSRGDFDEKLERERRYGEVYRLQEQPNGYLLEVEFPRRVPKSSTKEELGVPDEMPDYDYDISLNNGMLVVKGKVADTSVRKLAAVSPAFPPDFTTNIKLPSPVAGFKHRFRGKTLEVALVKNI
jgi:ferredoxin